MHNYLKFDVYNLELKKVYCNSNFHRLLIGTDNRSILVLEDINHTFTTIESNRKKGYTSVASKLRAMVNVEGEERILVSTTNHEVLDATFLRPARIDVELHMSYCSFTAFKARAYNYFEETEHELLGEMKELLENVDATPVEIAGELFKRLKMNIFNNS